jgi:CRP/FNR family cyclic AMP-dependent transcriptional regulator
MTQHSKGPSSASSDAAFDDSATGEILAARLLVAPTALTQLSGEEARVVVSYMEPAHFSAGTCFIREGDAADTGFMALIIQGEVVVENIIVSRTAPDTTAVLGPGSLVGEVGLLDSGPRSASCTAGTELFCAILTRTALQSLVKEQPAIGAKLLMAVSARIAVRLRDTVRKLRIYAKLAQTMQTEINRMM